MSDARYRYLGRRPRSRRVPRAEGPVVELAVERAKRYGVGALALPLADVRADPGCRRAAVVAAVVLAAALVWVVGLVGGA